MPTTCAMTRVPAKSGSATAAGRPGHVVAEDKVGEIALDSHPESFQLEQSGRQVFVDVPKEFGVAVVDRRKRAVISKWGLDWTFGNYPMALDEAERRLFVGCRIPARLVILNTNSDKWLRNFRYDWPLRLRNW
jgi:ABC-type uncharacterized transport system permease subunit